VLGDGVPIAGIYGFGEFSPSPDLLPGKEGHRLGLEFGDVADIRADPATLRKLGRGLISP